MRDIIALVGLPASGKSVASRTLAELGYAIVRLGDITDDEILRRGLEINEENEKIVREALRKDHGMDAYAKLNLARIKEHDKVVIDGLRSFEELTFFKKEFGEYFRVVAIDTPTELRHERMQKRKVRPLTKKECIKRDHRELDILGVRKTLTHAEKTIENNGDLETYISDVKALV